MSQPEQASAGVTIRLLADFGPNLPFPHSSKLISSRHAAMRELRIQHQGRPIRVLYIFDPRRVAILLLGGNKTGDDRWYERNVPLADRIYDELLREMEEERRAQTDKME